MSDRLMSHSGPVSGFETAEITPPSTTSRMANAHRSEAGALIGVSPSAVGGAAVRFRGSGYGVGSHRATGTGLLQPLAGGAYRGGGAVVDVHREDDAPGDVGLARYVGDDAHGAFLSPRLVGERDE